MYVLLNRNLYVFLSRPRRRVIPLSDPDQVSANLLDAIMHSEVPALQSMRSTPANLLDLDAGERGTVDWIPGAQNGFQPTFQPVASKKNSGWTARKILVGDLMRWPQIPGTGRFFPKFDQLRKKISSVQQLISAVDLLNDAVRERAAELAAGEEEEEDEEEDDE